MIYLYKYNTSEVSFFSTLSVAPRYIEVSQAGHVTLKTHVDDSDLPSQQNFLTFPVYATDRGVPPCATIGGLKIIVSGVNDNPPEICFKGVCGVDEIEVRSSWTKTFVTSTASHI